MTSRSTDEFLREFAIVMTDKGVVSITDPMHLAIYSLLCERSMRPSELTEMLSMPSSSLHFILDKMVDSGIIVRSKPDPAKKEVQYSVLALKIAASAPTSPEKIARSKRAFSSPVPGYTGLAAAANMMEAYTDEIGLDLSQLRDRYVRDLADSLKGDIGTGSMEEAMEGIVSRITGLTGYRASVYALNPLTVVFEGDEAMPSKMDMLSRLFAYMVENATSRHNTVRSVEDFSGDGGIRFKVTYERAEPEAAPYINTTLPQVSEPDSFLVIDIDGCAALLMSDVQTRLVEVIYERPLCISDIVAVLDMPRSTVTANLLKMIEGGVVSVFYSESGSVYYGLSCSILMKRARRVSRDQAPTRSAIRAAGADQGFVGGYLLYLQASLQELGFDTDYLMVVLGAKYMRAAGADGPKNFDYYFGKMSDIAKVFGLSMGVASVYPLTIGISRECGDSSMAPAMTFVKGMAHQGLEMASSGIFVRNTEETGDDVKVSFKEIYPTLSMSAASAEDAAADAAAGTAVLKTKKRRSSNVRDALRVRGSRSEGRPARTVRYITAAAFVVMFAAILVFTGGVGTDNTASVESFEVSVDSPGIVIYDSDGMAMDTPCIVTNERPLLFSVSSSSDVGAVRDGIAYPLDAFCTDVGNGVYSLSLSSDVMFTEVREMEMPREGLSVSLYDFGRTVSEGYAASFDGYIPAEDYAAAAGGLWASADAVVSVSAAEGSYVSTGSEDGAFLTRVTASAWGFPDISAEALPSDCVVVTFRGAAFEVYGFYASSTVMVEKGRRVAMDLVSTGGPVRIYMDGSMDDLAFGNEVGSIVFDTDRDATLVCEPLGIY